MCCVSKRLIYKQSDEGSFGNETLLLRTKQRTCVTFLKNPVFVCLTSELRIHEANQAHLITPERSLSKYVRVRTVCNERFLHAVFL